MMPGSAGRGQEACLGVQLGYTALHLLSHTCTRALSLGWQVKFHTQGLGVAFFPLVAWKGGWGKNQQSK